MRRSAKSAKPAESAQQSQPWLSYVVASTPRTGSTLLCRALAQTGIAGRPDEYLAPALYRSRFAREWGYGPPHPRATTRVERAMQHTATPNGVFALHPRWYDFALLLRTMRNMAGLVDVLDQVDSLLVSPRYVHISRRDTAAQALSYYRAIYTGEASVVSDSPHDRGISGPEPVDLEQVRWLEDTLVDWETQWRTYFARCDIQPLEISYEDLAADYRPNVERVLDFLDFTSVPAVASLEAPNRTSESDWTQRWLDEYRAVRDGLAPQSAEESWSRRDQIFETSHSTESPGRVPTGKVSGSTSRFDDEVVFSCVVDKPPFLVYQSLIWVLTLTRLAGLSPQRLVVHVVEGTDAEHAAVLRSLGVRVVPVVRFDERNVYANKLRQLTEGALVEASASVLCDCDIAFAGDVTPLTRGDEIGGKPVGAGVPTLMEWHRLIATAGMTRELRLGRPAGGRLEWTCAQNLNGGLLVIPHRFHDLLAEAWPRWFGWILDHGDELAGSVNRFAGQVSFGLALLELDLPIRTMPAATNFPMGGADATLTDNMSPLALHYHSRLTPAGRLIEPGVPAVDAIVAKVNALLDESANRELLEVALRNWQATLER